jgi:hypothetical protein
MRANEKKFQSFIRKMFARFRDGLRFLGDLLKEFFRFLSYLSAARGVNHASARDMEQPGFRFSGTPSAGHRFNAATNASPSASSAAATSPDRAAR